MIEFSDALADTHTLEIIDMRLALLIVNGLLPYYRAKKNADVKKYIHCLFRRLALSYNVAQNFDISELVGDLTEEHRNAVIACADEGLPLIENAKVFASLPPESRQELVTIQLFRATGYERSYYSQKLVRAQLSSYEKCLALFSRPDIQKAAPEVDWDFQIFSVYSYISAVQEFFFYEDVPHDILDTLHDAVYKALDYVQTHPDNYRVSKESLDASLAAIRFYRGDVSFKDTIEGYIRWNKQGDPTQYDRVSMDANLLSLVMPLWMFRQHPDEVKNYRDFILAAQKSSFDYIRNARDQGTYDTMQRYTGYIIDDYVELEGSISFKDYYQNILITTQPALYVHCQMVGRIAALILDEMVKVNPETPIGVWGMETEEEVRASQEKLRDFLLEGCLFHDIGKFFLLGTINQYSRFLFPDEFLLVQRHSVMGSRLLKKHASTEKFANLALFHHRWYDEKGGYPSNLSFFGDPDSVLYYIVTCADCLDAATDSIGRAYSTGKDFALMLEDMRSNAGRMFAPEVVELFDQPELQEKTETLLTETREALYRDVFKRKGL